jgi:hypothetical protein
MRKNENGGSRSQRSGGKQRRGHRRSAAAIERDFNQLYAWHEGRARLELTRHGEVCPSRYVGHLLQSDLAAFAFMGIGADFTLTPGQALFELQ